jgi:hypothetical protein
MSRRILTPILASLLVMSLSPASASGTEPVGDCPPNWTMREHNSHPWLMFLDHNDDGLICQRHTNGREVLPPQSAAGTAAWVFIDNNVHRGNGS